MEEKETIEVAQGGIIQKLKHFFANNKDKYFNLQGRLNREQYIKRILSLVVMSFLASGLTALFILLTITLFAVEISGGVWVYRLIFMIAGGLSGMLSAVTGLFDIIFMVSGFTVIMRRIQDLGQPGWLAILFLIFPGFNLIGLVFLGLIEGQTEANKYGEVPSGS